MLAVQIAVILAPIVCGTLGEKVGWHWGFGSAGVGMLIGLVVYLYGRRWLPAEEARAGSGTATVSKPPLSRQEKGRLVLLLAMIPVLMLSIVGNQQYNNAFPLWSQKHMDLLLLSWQVPVTWLQAVDALISTGTMLASLAFWRWWSVRRREPDELSKMAMGSLLAATAPALLVIAAASIDGTDEKVSFAWTLGYTLLNDLGFANILPVGLALYSRSSPRQMAGLMVGVYYLHLFLGNSFVGWLAGLLEEIPGTQFWGLHAVLVAAAGVLLLAIKLLFGKMLLPDEEVSASIATESVAGATAA
jgi:POT family proton-dependent oligopeptide transporter